MMNLASNSGDLRFAPSFPNIRTHVRVFGNEFLSSKSMTGDRNEQGWMFGMYV
jgi:hypothetical protein